MACAAARVDASRINANKASCVNCIIASWCGAATGEGSAWGGDGARTWGGNPCLLSGACSRGGRTSARGGDNSRGEA
ncbi:UNVERIFIED_CONTAM: hypothetical protein Slati_4452200 [Sesamum latifolium]|uniref:Uncharacterized protein n=1 Tax=Sesamum latifolium TaxID=2727402 RepID=A0AAW2SRV3_9LAMI